MEPGGSLQQLLDTSQRPVPIPLEGIVLTDYLGGILGVKAGDMLTIEVLEGERPTRQVPIAGLAKQFIGIMGYMEMGALNRLMREGPSVSGAYIAADSRYQADIYKTLVGMPRVAGLW